MPDVFPHTLFAVADRPLCVWDQDLQKHNLNFCRSLDPDWFLNAIGRHFSDLEIESAEELPQDAALGVRLLYHHALETFVALLFAVLQAPHCLPAWLNLYQLPDLRDLIDRVQRQAPILNAWGVPRPSWEDLAVLFHGGLDPETDEGQAMASGFAGAWSRFAAEFLEDRNRAEYNGIKHGFRARPGGSAIRIAPEAEYGVPGPEEASKPLGGSRHGSAVFVTDPIPSAVKPRKAVHFHLRTRNILWIAEATIQKVQLLSASMKNLLGAARIRHGEPADEVQFHRLAEPADYWRPWSRTTGITDFSMGIAAPNDAVAQIAAEQIRETLRRASGLEGKGAKS